MAHERREHKPDLCVFEFGEIRGADYEAKREEDTHIVGVHDICISELVLEPSDACASAIIGIGPTFTDLATRVRDPSGKRPALTVDLTTDTLLLPDTLRKMNVKC